MLTRRRRKQWVSKLESWGLKKNVTAQEMENIVRIQKKRKNEDDKDTRFTVRSRKVPQNNIDRWQKRSKTDASNSVVQASDPDRKIASKRLFNTRIISG